MTSLYAFTRHAKERSTARSISPMIVELIIEYGESRDAGDGARKYALTKRSMCDFADAPVLNSPKPSDSIETEMLMSSQRGSASSHPPIPPAPCSIESEANGLRNFLCRPQCLRWHAG